MDAASIDVTPPIPKPVISQIKSLTDDDLETLHNHIHGMQFPHPDEDLGLVNITGYGRLKRSPITFYNTIDLDENYSSTWEVWQWLNAS